MESSYHGEILIWHVIVYPDPGSCARKQTYRRAGRCAVDDNSLASFASEVHVADVNSEVMVWDKVVIVDCCEGDGEW